jgi:hypothetical protein
VRTGAGLKDNLGNAGILMGRAGVRGSLGGVAVVVVCVTQAETFTKQLSARELFGKGIDAVVEACANYDQLWPKAASPVNARRMITTVRFPEFSGLASADVALNSKRNLPAQLSKHPDLPSLGGPVENNRVLADLAGLVVAPPRYLRRGKWCKSATVG